MAELPSGTVTFLFTDLEGSTRLWEQHPDAMRAALARHDEILREAVEKYAGHVVKTTGDGVHAVFAIAIDGVDAAVDAQRRLIAEPWPLPDPLTIRMGLHTGAADLRDGDYYGTAVNRAARISGAAHGGQIVTSAATADLVRDDLSDGVALTDLGEHRLRDLGRPERIVQVDAPGLPSDFAALRTLDAYPGNLPLQRTAFIGRERELAEILDVLGDAPVVTLTGVGGVGKTRLALQAAAAAVVQFPDGVWLAELAPVVDDAGVAAAVATALGLPERSDPADAIVASLRRRRVLVVVDNCEHVVDAAARLVDQVTHACPGVTILATSREALGVEGEATLEIRPLGTGGSRPASSDGAPLGDAVELFVERARSAKRSFALDATTTPVVVQICQRLDGIPLAIELAAARLQLMSPSEILANLDERFRLLTGGRRTVLERHQTLRSAIDWSYALLDADEQRLFGRLAVFVGGFTLDGADAIADIGGDGQGVDTLDVLGSLVAKSMIITEPAESGTRYAMLETLRAYGLEQLAAHDDPVRVNDAHAAYQLAFVQRSAPGLFGPDDGIWLPRIKAEVGNFRNALAWLARRDDPREFLALVQALGRFWHYAETFRDAWTWSRLALEVSAGSDAAANTQLLAYCGWAANGIGEHDAVIDRLEESIRCAKDAGIPVVPLALCMLGIAALESYRPDDAIRLCELGVEAARDQSADEYLQLDAMGYVGLAYALAGAETQALIVADEFRARAERLGNQRMIEQSLFTAGVAWFTSRPDDAVAVLEQCLQSSVIGGFRDGQCYLFLGLAQLRLREIPEAARSFRSALPIFVAGEAPYFAATVLGAATFLLARSDPPIAVQVLAALSRYREESGMAGAPLDVEGQHRNRARLEQSMGTAAFASAWDAGLALTLEQAADINDQALGAISAS